MNDFQSGMLESMGLVYASHGGIRALLVSGYFWLSVILTMLCWQSFSSEDWIPIALAALPTFAGFSVAAYAILFAVLDEKARNALAAPEPSLGGRSPLLVIVGTVTHAVLVQVIAMLFAFCFQHKPLPMFLHFIRLETANMVWSAMGVFLFLYSISLVLASVLTIFRILEIRTRAS